MTTSLLFDQIRSNWITRIAQRMAKGEGVRESFLQELERLSRLIQQALETGDAGWLEPMLDDWIEARTQSELEQRGSQTLVLLNSILVLTVEVAQELLPAQDALLLVGAICPLLTYAGEYVVRRERDLRVLQVTLELEKARTTLERLDKSKSDFISIAAHELKTPLTLIEGYTTMLREQIQAEPAKPHTTAFLLLQGVGQGARRLREIVDDMIDVSMIDNNLLPLRFQPVWINRLLQMVQQELQTCLEERHQVLLAHPIPGGEEMTFGDEERLFQAFHNVISNAIKYTPDGGKIILSGRRLPGFIEVVVRDTGIGIDPDDQPRIFEKFGRIGDVALHSSGKTKFKGGGPGLGLPITKGIVEAHGGAIWVESEGYDEARLPGTAFHILLPMLKAPPDDKTAKLFHPLIENYSQSLIQGIARFSDPTLTDVEAKGVHGQENT